MIFLDISCLRALIFPYIVWRSGCKAKAFVSLPLISRDQEIVWAWNFHQKYTLKMTIDDMTFYWSRVFIYLEHHYDFSNQLWREPSINVICQGHLLAKDSSSEHIYSWVANKQKRKWAVNKRAGWERGKSWKNSERFISVRFDERIIFIQCGRVEPSDLKYIIIKFWLAFRIMRLFMLKNNVFRIVRFQNGIN